MSWTPWRLLLCTLVQRRIQERTPDDTSPQPVGARDGQKKVEGHTCSYGRKEAREARATQQDGLSMCRQIGCKFWGTTPSVSEAATSAGRVSHHPAGAANPKRGSGAAGASHDSPSASKTPSKFHERTPKREKKEKCGGRKGKNRAKFWAVRRRGGPAEGSGGAPKYWTNTHSRHTQQTHTTHTADTHNTHSRQTHKSKSRIGNWSKLTIGQSRKKQFGQVQLA